ncbi:TPA: hypothetical protein U2D36_000802 [Streptococcus suis]|nr:hypothetical protein [Streptococcus suis]HEM6356420.1 hypothetical protein [Streptococcus suis]HEM6380554.1 hypothetical protein [Streptococcus suis]HEM6409774.1 hypothetical protein [Streptococcus suis]
MGKSTKRVMKEKQESFKPLIYICAPYRGDVAKNIEDAIRYAEFAYQQGNVPITPHLFFPFLNEEKEEHRQDALAMDLILLGKCQEVWVFGSEITEGMQVELAVSKRRRQTIRYFSKDCKEVQHENRSRE